MTFMMVADVPGLNSVLGHEHDPTEAVEVRVDLVCDNNDEKLRDDNDDIKLCDVVPDDDAKGLCDVFDEDADNAFTLVICEDVRKSLV